MNIVKNEIFISMSNLKQFREYVMIYSNLKIILQICETYKCDQLLSHTTFRCFCNNFSYL